MSIPHRKTSSSNIPSGGTTNEVLKKNSDADRDFTWGTGGGGEDGKTVRNGTGAPSSLVGVDGDFYIDTNANSIYGPKASGSWGSATSLVGPAGATGSQGPTGSTGANGATGPQGPAGVDGATTFRVTKAKGTSTASVANLEVDLTWASPSPSSSTVTVSGADITIDEDGDYVFDVSVRADGNNRTELFIYTYVDTGSGYVQDTDEISSNYATRNSTQDTGVTHLNTALSLNSGDKVKFAAFGQAAGTCVLLTAGTILRVIN